jgi:hypothetical protein
MERCSAGHKTECDDSKLLSVSSIERYPLNRTRTRKITEMHGELAAELHEVGRKCNEVLRSRLRRRVTVMRAMAVNEQGFRSSDIPIFLESNRRATVSIELCR